MATLHRARRAREKRTTKVAQESFTRTDERLAADIFSQLRGAEFFAALRALHLVTVAYLKSARLDGPPGEWEYIRLRWLRLVRDLPAPYVMTKDGLARVEADGWRVLLLGK